MPVTLVIGGQFGSEGKGSVVSYLARSQHFDLAIRTGSPNAGHTFRYRDALYKMRQLPCTWFNGYTDMYIPPSAVINLEVLRSEIAIARSHGYRGQIWVHPLATVINAAAMAMENEATIQTGTTHEGVGGARALRMLRKAKLARDYSIEGVRIGEPAMLGDILVESTQGFGLSLDVSYPHCTSSNLDTYRLLGEAGIPYNSHSVRVVMVLRTFPIRIAGASGPLANETSWPALRAIYGDHIPDEQTTVTKKTRRVGEFDFKLAKHAIDICRPTEVVLTFFDYIFPKIKVEGWTPAARQWLFDLESRLGRKVDYVGVGIGELLKAPF